jgi:hypothetical protein
MLHSTNYLDEISVNRHDLNILRQSTRIIKLLPTTHVNAYPIKCRPENELCLTFVWRCSYTCNLESLEKLDVKGLSLQVVG